MSVHTKCTDIKPKKTLLFKITISSPIFIQTHRFCFSHTQTFEKTKLAKNVQLCRPAGTEGARGCLIKKCTKLLLHTAKMIDPRVKSQARGQNNWSRASK